MRRIGTSRMSTMNVSGAFRMGSGKLWWRASVVGAALTPASRRGTESGELLLELDGLGQRLGALSRIEPGDGGQVVTPFGQRGHGQGGDPGASEVRLAGALAGD